MKGRVQGTILLEKGREYPKATFQAAGTNVSAIRIEAETFQAGGKFDWPELDDFKARVQFASNSVFRVEGSGDLRSRVLRETIVSGEGALLTNLLPKNIQFSGVRIDARISGAITNLKHEGAIELRDFVAPQIEPLSVQASWKAQQITFEDLALRARAGPAVLFISGSGYAAGGRTNFVVRELN